ncbi:MAG: GlsB/YeaQ/YmgE family stress response membrane protein [Bacteroidales bacterium]|nr:GlsB/YeaQ/YmgE family stress response membrane protein [Bacteroidales bacterium]
MGVLLSVIIGCLAGYLGSIIFGRNGKKKGFSGLLIYLIIGIIGGFIGGSLFGWLGIGGGSLLWQLVSATVGALILLWIISLIRGK